MLGWGLVFLVAIFAFWMSREQFLRIQEEEKEKAKEIGTKQLELGDKIHKIVLSAAHKNRRAWHDASGERLPGLGPIQVVVSRHESPDDYVIWTMLQDEFSEHGPGGHRGRVFLEIIVNLSRPSGLAVILYRGETVSREEHFSYPLDNSFFEMIEKEVLNFRLSPRAA